MWREAADRGCVLMTRRASVLRLRSCLLSLSIALPSCLQGVWCRLELTPLPEHGGMERLQHCAASCTMAIMQAGKLAVIKTMYMQLMAGSVMQAKGLSWALQMAHRTALATNKQTLKLICLLRQAASYLLAKT